MDPEGGLEDQVHGVEEGLEMEVVQEAREVQAVQVARVELKTLFAELETTMVEQTEPETNTVGETRLNY